MPLMSVKGCWGTSAKTSKREFVGSQKPYYPPARHRAAAFCLTPGGFQTPSSARGALRNLAEQVLDLKAHLCVKWHRYRSLICHLGWRHSGKRKVEKEGRNARGESCSSSYAFCMQRRELTCSGAPKKTATESSTVCPKLEEVFALLWVSRNSQPRMMHKLGASQTPSCSNIFLWSRWHPCKMRRGVRCSALLLSSWRNVKLNLSMLSPHSFLLAPWHVSYN